MFKFFIWMKYRYLGYTPPPLPGHKPNMKLTNEHYTITAILFSLLFFEGPHDIFVYFYSTKSSWHLCLFLLLEHVDDILSKLKSQMFKTDVKQRQAMVGENVTIFAGKSFKFYCPVGSSKNIQIKWLQNGRLLRSNSRVLIDDNMLIILDTKRKSQYSITCLIQGVLGSAKITSHMNIIGMF